MNNINWDQTVYVAKGAVLWYTEPLGEAVIAVFYRE